MDDCCISLVIKQIYCQNGIRRTIDNSYTNINNGTEIPLEFGYLVTVTAITDRSLNITLSNPVYIPNITFTIPENSFKIIDLPVVNSSYRLYIGVKATCCNNN